MLGLYDFLTAEKIEWFDDTENVKKLLSEIKLEDLRNPEVWKNFIVLVEIKPDEDLLPVRAKYDGENFTVGLNYVTSKDSMFFGLPSIILSVLSTGKMPKIKSAIRFVAAGKQKSLCKTNILGMEVNPLDQNVFKLLVEERHRCKKAHDIKEKCIKIIVNSTAYGIYMQLDREDKKSNITVYTGKDVFEEKNKHFEKEGKYYHPIIAVFICDAAKLFLGIGDCILQKHNEVITYCDTDSMFVPPQYADEIIGWFDPLCPYSNIEHLLKVEEKDIWFLGISAKRYVLYDIDKECNFIIKGDEGAENYSLHGLGHLANPFGESTKHWQKEIWLDILAVQYNKMSNDGFLDKYKNYYAASQFTVTTESLMRRFEFFNKGKPYGKTIKPLNFFLIGFSNDKSIKPIAPFSKDTQSMPHGVFINYRNGKIMKGQQHFKTLADELWNYMYHPESKLEGKKGTLQRRHLLVNNIYYIGKEADKLEERIYGVGIKPNVYNNPKDIEKALMLEWKEVKSCGISKKQFYRLRKLLREGKALHLSGKNLKRLRSISGASQNNSSELV